MGQVIENIDTAILMEEGSISYDEMPIGIIHSFLFKFFKPGVDIENEMKLIVKEKTNKQLNQYSNIYFNKIKKNIKINEL